MDYYDLKRRAGLFIDEKVCAAEEMNVSKLILSVERVFGLGHLFVKKRLDLMKKAGDVFIDETKDTVTWIGGVKR